jgi:hypothetical protein
MEQGGMAVMKFLLRTISMTKSRQYEVVDQSLQILYGMLREISQLVQELIQLLDLQLVLMGKSL